MPTRTLDAARLIGFTVFSLFSPCLVASPSAAPLQNAAPAKLSQTQLFEDAALSRVRPGTLTFVPQYPLWTDGAQKRRWVQLPPGGAVDASRPDAFDFPVGTRFWKEFSFAGRRVETRMLERLADGAWRYTTYLWNRAGTEAERVPVEGVGEGVPVGASGQRHVIPGEADCRACHEGRATPVLGFSALQLSPDRDPGAVHAEAVPPEAVGLPELVQLGLLKNLPPRLLATPPRIPAPTPTARAALGYLHANCGGCHNGEGPLAVVGLSLAHELEASDAGRGVLDTLLRPSHFRLPSLETDSFRVVPGRPDKSAVAFRMRSRAPSTQMPPLGTAVVDEAGLALVERWIREIDPSEHKETTP